MSEKAEKKPEAAPAAAPTDKKAGGGMLSKTPVLVGGAMMIEAVVLLVGIWIFRGKSAPAPVSAEINGINSKTAEGGDAAAAPEADDKRLVEIPVVDFRALNRRSGHTFLYDITIVATTKAKFEKQVKDKIAERGNLIRDHIRTIIAESDPEKLGGGSEPGLETLRRQVKYQLDVIIGEGQIDEVLVPKCIPYRADF